MEKKASSQNSQREEGNLKTQQHVLRVHINLKTIFKNKKKCNLAWLLWFFIESFGWLIFFSIFLWWYILKTIDFLPAGGGVYGVLKYTGRLWEQTLSTDANNNQVNFISTLLIVKLQGQKSYYVVWKAQNNIYI